VRIASSSARLPLPKGPSHVTRSLIPAGSVRSSLRVRCRLCEF
jgi:hypothetical protein